MNEGPTHQSLNSHPEIKADFSNQCQQSCSSLIVGEDTVIYSQNHTVFGGGKRHTAVLLLDTQSLEEN